MSATVHEFKDNVQLFTIQSEGFFNEDSNNQAESIENSHTNVKITPEHTQEIQVYVEGNDKWEKQTVQLCKIGFNIYGIKIPKSTPLCIVGETEYIYDLFISDGIWFCSCKKKPIPIDPEIYLKWDIASHAHRKYESKAIQEFCQDISIINSTLIAKVNFVRKSFHLSMAVTLTMILVFILLMRFFESELWQISFITLIVPIFLIVSYIATVKWLLKKLVSKTDKYIENNSSDLNSRGIKVEIGENSAYFTFTIIQT